MHAPVPMAAWPLAVTAAVAGVAVGSYLTVLNDWVLADQVLADRVLADRAATGSACRARVAPAAPHPRGPRGLAATAPGPRDDSARGRGGPGHGPGCSGAAAGICWWNWARGPGSR